MVDNNTYAPLYKSCICQLCGRECLHGVARENHARKHEREGRVVIKGFGGPSGRRYIIRPTSTASA